MIIDTINNIREQTDKIKEIVRLQEIKEKGLSNNKEVREKLNYPTAEQIIKDLR